MLPFSFNQIQKMTAIYVEVSKLVLIGAENLLTEIIITIR